MTKITFNAIALLAVLTLTACSTAIERYTEKYKKEKSQKALAIGSYWNGAWVGSWSSDQPTLEKAKEIALKSCEEYALKNRGYIECRIMYENDTFISSKSKGVTH